MTAPNQFVGKAGGKLLRFTLVAAAALTLSMLAGCAGPYVAGSYDEPYVAGPYTGPYYGDYGPYDPVFVTGGYYGEHHFYGHSFGHGGFHGGGFHGGFHGGGGRR